MAREELDLAQFQRRLERQDDPNLVSLTGDLSWKNWSDSYIAVDDVRITKCNIVKKCLKGVKRSGIPKFFLKYNVLDFEMTSR